MTTITQDNTVRGAGPGITKWSPTNPPPEGHADVGAFAWGLFELAKKERDRAGLPERFEENYKLYRGDHWQKKGGKADANKISVGLFFANVQRTVANVTARDQVAEIVDLDGDVDEADQILSSKLVKWWKDTRQRRKLATSATGSEIYGTTIEKAYWDGVNHRPDIQVLDVYAFLPAPGQWDDVSADAPYVCCIDAMPIEEIEAKFGVEGVKVDSVYSVLGEARENLKPIPAGIRSDKVYYDHTTGNTLAHPSVEQEVDQARGLVVEVWIRDFSMITVNEPEMVEVADQETGAVMMVEMPRSVTKRKYPDGIRKITVTNGGDMVLDDQKNPNINWKIPEEALRKCYLYGRFPFKRACSYEDATSFWGFSAAEQVGDLNYKIDEIFSRLAAYVSKTLAPTLVIPQGIGISKSMISNRPNLVLRPNKPIPINSIGYLPVPPLPHDFFNILNIFVNFHDRIYSIEDVDRGQSPSGITAASAIVALQERNAVLMKSKIASIGDLIEFRGAAAISLYQNFGLRPELLDVNGTRAQFAGVEYAGRRFNYVVEAGSTMPKTSLQVQAQSEAFYKMGVIDRQALLENSNYPGWKEIVERVSEGQVGQALQLLVQAGLPEQDAQMLHQFLMENQGGPGNRPQNPPQNQGSSVETGQPAAGVPRAEQGAQI